MDSKPSFNYPSEIELGSNPLIEAWLTIHWKLEPTDPSGLFVKGSGFSLVLGKFYVLIKDRFDFTVELEANKLPEQAAPYIARYQFRPNENEWPVLQLVDDRSKDQG